MGGTVATVFNPQPTHEEHRRQRLWESRTVSGLMSLAEVGAQLRRECRAVGTQQAERVIALTDGGAGLEECLLDVAAGQCQELIFILDFWHASEWHASEHLREFAKVFFPEESVRDARVAAWCHRLKHAGGPALLAELQALNLSRASPLARESHRQLSGYFRHNLHRMNYPKYLQNGWQIGSGKVESTCKSVVATRLKGPAGTPWVRWHTRGTTALCQLRALYKNKSQPECWRSYWKPKAVT